MPGDKSAVGAPPAALVTPSHVWRRHAIPIVVFVAFALMPVLAQVASKNLILSLATRTAVLATAAVALDLLIGACGLVSFGHAAFLGIGSYSVVILASYGFDDLGLQIVVAIGASLVFGAITGVVSLRTQGVYFIMITLAFAQMLFFFATSLSAFGGDDGITLPSRSTLFGASVLGTDRALFYVALACLLGAYVFCRVIVASRFGRVLRGARDNTERMNAIGFAPTRFRFVAYLISVAITAVAGVLLAETSEFVSPSIMSWQRSADLVFMVVLGGLGTLHGAILGSIAFVLLSEGLSRVTENWHIVFGPLLVLSVLFLRGGLARQIARAR